MTGVEELQALNEAGFSQEEMGGFHLSRTKELMEAGFNQGEINTYWGSPPFDPNPIVSHVNEALTKATAPDTAEGAKKPVKDFLEAFEHGFSMSSASLLMKPPTTELAPDASRASRIAANVGTLAGDIPAMVGGYVLGGGNPITGTAGAFALPPGLRKIMMDKYAKGEVSSFADFWDRASGAAIDTLKGWVTGAATGAVGKAIGLAPIPSQTVKNAATVTGEVATMVTVGSALEGHMPEPDDFVDAAIALGFIKGSSKIAQKLRDVYTRTAVKPEAVVADAVKDPTILQDLASDRPVPESYGKEQPFVMPETAAEAAPLKSGQRYLLALRGELTIPAPKADPLALPPPVEQMSRFDLAITPRHETHIDQNAEMLARAEKAVADMEIAGEERGGRNFYETQGMGSTEEVIGFKSATADWYKEATTGQRKLSRERVEVALQKIIDDKGKDVGSDVRRIKELILADTEFEQSEFAPKTDEEWSRARQYAMAEWEPDVAMAGGSPPRAPKGKATPQTPIEEARAKVSARISVGEEQGKKATFEDVYTDLIDKLNPMRQAVKRANEIEGLPDNRPTAEDAYRLARLSRGTFGKASHFLEHATFDFETYKNTGPSLRQIVEPVKDDLQGLREYAVAKRTQELNERGITTGVDLQAANTTVRAGGKYAEVFTQLVDYQNNLTLYLKKSGILSDQAYEAMKDANRDYVPFYRVMDEGEEMGGTAGGRKVRQPIKRIRGSEREIHDPLESIIKNTYTYVALAERNAVGHAYVKMAKKSGKPGDFIEKVPDPVKPIQLREDEIRKAFDEFMTVTKQQKRTQTEQTKTTQTGGIEGQEPPGKALQLVTARVKEALKARGFSTGETDQMVNRIAGGGKGADHTTTETVIREIERTTYVPELNIRLPNDAATIWRTIQIPLKPNEIAVFEGGKRTVYKVDPDVASAFKASDAESVNLLLKILAIPAKSLRAGAVLSPDFIARNLVRDQLSAFVLTRGGYIPIFDFVRGATSLAKQDHEFGNWLKGGGANAAMVSVDRRYLQESILKLTKEDGLWDKAWNVVKSPLHLLRVASELTENATRLGEFKRVTKGATDKATIQEGAYASREVTLDFARMGAKMRAVNMISAFSNAAVQGVDRTVRAFKEEPVQTSLKVAGAITVPSILLWIANHEDPRYKEIPDWQKDLFWIVMTKDHIYRIPKPFELGVIFGSLPERALDAYYADKPEAFKNFEKAILDAFLPNLTPNVAQPVIEQFANRSLLTGHPLIPASAEKLLPEYQYTEYTTEAAKAIGGLIGAFPGITDRAIKDEQTFIGGTARALSTPALIENYLRAWTGGLGMYVLQIADKALRETGVLPDPVLPANTLADLPVIKAFTVRYPSATTQSIQDFYSNYAASQKYYNTIMHLATQGDPKAVDLIHAHQEDLAQLSDLKEALSQQSQVIRLIHKNPEMSRDDKRQLIDTLYFRMIELSQAGNTAMKDLKEQVK